MGEKKKKSSIKTLVFEKYNKYLYTDSDHGAACNMATTTAVTVQSLLAGSQKQTGNVGRCFSACVCVSSLHSFCEIKVTGIWVMTFDTGKRGRKQNLYSDRRLTTQEHRFILTLRCRCEPVAQRGTSAALLKPKIIFLKHTLT